jgi:hypothetical protein
MNNSMNARSRAFDNVMITLPNGCPISTSLVGNLNNSNIQSHVVGVTFHSYTCATRSDNCASSVPSCYSVGHTSYI